MAGARYIRWHFAARRADCAAASSRQAHRRAAVSRRRRLDGEGARRATITWLQMAPPNDAEHMLTILLFFNRRADGARPVHSIRSRRALLTHSLGSVVVMMSDLGRSSSAAQPLFGSTRYFGSVSEPRPPNGCSPWVRPFPPRLPPGAAPPCSVASQVLWPHPTSHPRTCSACGLSPSRAGPAHESGVCTENDIRVYQVTESAKLAQ